MCADGATRSYLLAGLVQCRLCGRRMDAHWVNGRAGYRCRHGYASARVRPPDAPRNLHVREDALLSRMGGQVHSGRCLRVMPVNPVNIAEVVAHLRAESKVIICGTSGWTIIVAE